ncbi:Arylsulfatase A [Hyunsoonleella jejuensis]|uniref:Arylsulfatase A n=1 Tax=Hyunsoonleella jejuensis TaxID=419940 RepID=A0A1H9J0D7_9FLAO|nr:sulfatase [Hyunsoonleella jejuensis]SEQ80228.1 Arylsulfatase A [Hyunsoonleella jejuensis]
MKTYKLFNALLVLIIITVFSCKDETKKEEASVEKPKNILFIAVDDLKPLMGAYGHEDIKTPNIDKLAANGFVMQNSHCQQAVCGPSRASLLTGKRPDYTQVWDLKTLIRDKNPDIVTMPQYFKQNGYETAAIGKIFDFRSVDKGNDSISWTYPYDNFKHHSEIGREYIKNKERVSYEIVNVPDSLTADGEVVRRTVRQLRKFAEGDKPFFMATGFYKPHLPFVAPKKYWDMYPLDSIRFPEYMKAPEGAPAYATQPSWELRGGYADIPNDYNTPIPVEKQKRVIQGYYACVSFIDQQIGNVLDELDRLGLRENTVIVLWGDHGWHLGDHNMYCKHTNYEQSTKSPLIFSAGKDKIGESFSPTEFVDVYPTLLELAGVESPGNLDGVSLVPLMEKKVNKVKDFAVSQFPRDSDKMGYTFRNDRYRYTVWIKDEQPYESNRNIDEAEIVAEEFYDYKADPLETKNLIAEEVYQDAKADLKTKAIAYFKSQETNK